MTKTKFEGRFGTTPDKSPIKMTPEDIREINEEPRRHGEFTKEMRVTSGFAAEDRSGLTEQGTGGREIGEAGRKKIADAHRAAEAEAGLRENAINVARQNLTKAIQNGDTKAVARHQATLKALGYNE